MNKPAAVGGMRHVALWVNDFEACEKFYVELIGMGIEWRPDEDNLYLCSGCDNVALHRSNKDMSGSQHLDHIGFILNAIEDVDHWHQFLVANNVTIFKEPKTHRDGARSFYCADPDGNAVQMIYHPPISGKCL